MATTYVVFDEQPNGDEGVRHVLAATGVQAANSTQACRIVAEGVVGDRLDKGVTLIAVPERNWTSGRHTLKAETQRRIRSA